MASGLFAKGLEEMAAAGYDWEGGSIKLLLVEGTQTLNKETQQFLSDITAWRYTGTTDKALASAAISRDTVNNWIELGGAQTQWPSVTFGTGDATAVVGYYDSGVAATSPLIFFDDVADVTPDGNNINYNPNAEGIVQLTYGA
jgi:hypothetical protein